MPQFLTNLRDRKALKNLDDLELVNVELSEELREEFESYYKEKKETTTEIDNILEKIDAQQEGLKNLNTRINGKKNEIKELKQRMGLAKYLVFVRPAYWKLKGEMRYFKKLKKEKCKNIEIQYTKLQNIKRKMKERRIQRKTLSKDLKDMVEKRDFEIDFVKQYEKSKRKLQQSRRPKDIEIIEKAVNMIRENGGKWPENIQDEKGKSISAASLDDILKGDISVNELKEQIPEEKTTGEPKEEKKKEELEEEVDVVDYMTQPVQEEPREEKKKEELEEEVDVVDYMTQPVQEEPKGEKKKNKFTDIVNNGKTLEELKKEAEAEREIEDAYELYAQQKYRETHENEDNLITYDEDEFGRDD